MKKAIQNIAAVIGVASAVWVAFWIIRGVGCMMIHISETFNIPL